MTAAAATVAIPTRNRRARLIPLLERLIPQAADVGADILVVDNGSSDGTVEAVRALAGDRVRCTSWLSNCFWYCCCGLSRRT